MEFSGELPKMGGRKATFKFVVSYIGFPGFNHEVRREVNIVDISLNATTGYANVTDIPSRRSQYAARPLQPSDIIVVWKQRSLFVSPSVGADLKTDCPGPGEELTQTNDRIVFERRVIVGQVP